MFRSTHEALQYAVCSHHAPYELIQSKFKELVIDTRAALVFDWRKRILDDYYYCDAN